MQVFRALSDLPASYGPTVIAIGNFDGVHCGHRWIIDHARQRAEKLRAKCVAVTFDPHPVRVLRPEAAPRLITPLPERLRLLAGTGLDGTLVLPFTSEFSCLSAETFVRSVLRDGLHAVEVHEGDNFRFGHQAQAGIRDLIAMGNLYGFSVIAHPTRIVRGFPVSSSKIRELIASGNMTAARALLGRPFSVHSTPTRGRGIGSKLTVPTINLAPYDELLPANGVYITRMSIGNGPVLDAVTNIGNRPTFDGVSFAVETHLLDFQPVELSDTTPLELIFLRRIRPEMRFPTPDALKEQILRDVQQARRYFHLARLFQRD